MNDLPIGTPLSTLTRKTVYFSALCALLTLLTPLVRADDPGSKVHALVSLDFCDKYLTPRGMIVQDHGLTLQALLLGLVGFYHDSSNDAFLNDITGVVGVWNDYATSPIAEHLTPKSRKTDWIEYDPILGLSVGFAKNFKIDVTYTEFAMQILDIGTSQHLETKLSYDDTTALGAYSLHPYVSYWKELARKATAAANFGVPSSSYIDVGIAPAHTWGAIKLEVPIRMLLPEHNFYGQTFGPSSTVGLWEAGLKATMPANFIPPGYGHWSIHFGVNYMKFVDKNLQQLSSAGGFGNPRKETGQVFAGMTSFF